VLKEDEEVEKTFTKENGNDGFFFGTKVVIK